MIATETREQLRWMVQDAARRQLPLDRYTEAELRDALQTGYTCGPRARRAMYDAIATRARARGGWRTV